MKIPRGLCDKRFGFAADRQIGRFRGQISKQWGGRAKNWAVYSVTHRTAGRTAGSSEGVTRSPYEHLWKDHSHESNPKP